MRRPVLVPCLAVAALLAGAANVCAQVPPPHPARLTYLRSPGAVACPDQHLFELMIEGQNGGMNPFVKEAPDRIEVSFRLTKRGYVGRATVYDAQEKVHGSQEWTGRTCTDVAENISVLVSSWVAPLELLAKPPPKPRCDPVPSAPVAAPACVPVPVPPARKPEPPPPPRPSRPAVVVEGGTLLSFATLPRRPGFGLVAAIGGRGRAFSFTLEARADLPSATDPAPGSAPPVFASAWLFSGTLAPCVHVGFFVGCGLVSGGVLMEQSSTDPDITEAHPYVALGGRAGGELPLSSGLALRVSADLLVPLFRSSIVVQNNGHRIWTLPPVGGDLGLRFVYTFGGP
jgi:hypothetical protein